MPFADFGELREVIGDWLSRGDLAPQIPDFIRLAELAIQRDLMPRARDAKTTGTFTIGADSIPWPADMIEPSFLRIDSNPLRHIEVVSLDQLMLTRQNWSGYALPIAMAVVGDTLELAPAPATATEYTLYYRAGLALLSETNPTNKLLTQFPDLLLYGALTHAAPYVGDDPRVGTWAGLYGSLLKGAKRQEGRARTGGGPLRLRADRIA